MPLTIENLLRRCYFAPYFKGHGPSFTLVVWDTGRFEGGKWIIGYRLEQDEKDKETIIIFEAEDVGVPPIRVVDNDATIKAIMTFLTLKPGDTDEDYFAEYNQIQLDFCGEHAEALLAEVYNRFGD